MSVPAKHVAVVGSGIAGMTAAYRLQQAGCRVTVFEAEPHVGGRMTCRRIDGFTFNRAATLLAGKYDFLIGLIRELGLEDRIEYGHFKIGTPRGGKIYNLRTDRIWLDSALSGLLSWKSKLLMPRLLWDLRKLRSHLRYDDLSGAAPFDVETAEAYALRRLNREINDYVVDPAMAALLVARSSQPSSIDFMFTVAHYLGMGAYKVDGGIDFLVNELARRLPVRTNARVESIRESRGVVDLEWRESGAGVSRETVDGVVIATSAHTVPKIFPQISTVQAEILKGYRYWTILVGHFGLRSPPDMDADFLQIPYRENAELANVLFAHRQGKGNVPRGKGLIVTYARHEWSEARFDMDADQVLDEMLRSLDTLVPGVSRLVEVRNLERWKPALFRSEPGSYKKMAAFKASIDPHARVQLAGDYFSFTSTNASALSGDAAARRLIDSLSGPAR